MINLELVYQEIRKISEIENIDIKIDLINKLRLAIKDVSPFKDNPVDCVVWVQKDSVIGNEYNPNSVAPPRNATLRSVYS